MMGEGPGLSLFSFVPKSIDGPLVFLLDRRRSRHKKMPNPIKNETKATEPAVRPTIAPVLIGTVAGLEGDIRKSEARPWFYIRL